MSNKKLSIAKINSNLLFENLKKRNIELMPVRKNKCLYSQFRFINEDYTVKTNKPLACDHDVDFFECAAYFASFLKDDEAISEETFKEYIKQIDRLVNHNQCYC